ncbi:unnamed protein product, partial [Ectocarpus sp. 8 AP-2014]
VHLFVPIDIRPFLKILSRVTSLVQAHSLCRLLHAGSRSTATYGLSGPTTVPREIFFFSIRKSPFRLETCMLHPANRCPLPVQHSREPCSSCTARPTVPCIQSIR